MARVEHVVEVDAQVVGIQSAKGRATERVVVYSFESADVVEVEVGFVFDIYQVNTNARTIE